MIALNLGEHKVRPYRQITMNQSSNILIIGAGVLGSSLAYALSQKGESDILVIDPDLQGTYASTELNAGGIRATWWCPINVEISKASIEFYETIQDEILLRQDGYLFLHYQKRWKIAQEKAKMQKSLGWEVDLIQQKDIPGILPEFKNLKGIAGATYSPRDGLVDSHLLKDFYQKKAKTKGVKFLDRIFVTGMVTEGKRVDLVTCHRLDDQIHDEDLEDLMSQKDVFEKIKTEDVVFKPKTIVNCAGAWSPVIAKHYGRHDYPAYPLRRQLTVFEAPDVDFKERGMVVDASGLYMHPEGLDPHILMAGYSNNDEIPGFNFNYDGENKYFLRRIWMRLYRRGNRENFETCHHIRGWAGLYSQSQDRTGILWRVDTLDNVYELGSATGRGVMQSYALGQCMAELILKNKFETLDASPLSGDRFKTGELQEEMLDI